MSYNHVIIEANPNSDGFRILHGSYSIEDREVNLDTDEKVINPNLWKHLPSLIECRTSEAGLEILNKLAKISYNIHPLTLKYKDIISGKTNTTICMDFSSLISRFERKAEEKRYAESYVGQVSAFAERVYENSCSIM